MAEEKVVYQVNVAAYKVFCEALKEVAAGTRGWISLTDHAKLTGVKRQHLVVMAQSLNLHIDIHGKYGYCATRKA
jgi:hypothetical protein